MRTFIDNTHKFFNLIFGYFNLITYHLYSFLQIYKYFINIRHNIFNLTLVIYFNSVIKRAFGVRTFLRFTNQSFSVSLYPSGSNTTLRKPLSLRFRSLSKAALSKPPMGVESTFNSAAAAIAMPKLIYAWYAACVKFCPAEKELCRLVNLFL